MGFFYARFWGFCISRALISLPCIPCSKLLDAFSYLIVETGDSIVIICTKNGPYFSCSK